MTTPKRKRNEQFNHTIEVQRRHHKMQAAATLLSAATWNSTVEFYCAR